MIWQRKNKFTVAENREGNRRYKFCTIVSFFVGNPAVKLYLCRAYRKERKRDFLNFKGIVGFFNLKGLKTQVTFYNRILDWFA